MHARVDHVYIRNWPSAIHTYIPCTYVYSTYTYVYYTYIEHDPEMYTGYGLVCKLPVKAAWYRQKVQVQYFSASTQVYVCACIAMPGPIVLQV